MIKYQISFKFIPNLVFRLCEKTLYWYQLKDFFQAVSDECVFKSNFTTREMEITKGVLFVLIWNP